MGIVSDTVLSRLVVLATPHTAAGVAKRATFRSGHELVRKASQGFAKLMICSVRMRATISVRVYSRPNKPAHHLASGLYKGSIADAYLGSRPPDGNL